MIMYHETFCLSKTGKYFWGKWNQDTRKREKQSDNNNNNKADDVIY